MSGWHNGLTIAGLAALAYGLYLLHPALALIVTGGGAAVYGFVIALAKSKKGTK